MVEHGVNGFLVDTQKEWEQALRTLLNDADLRKRMGQAGRRKVEQHYCIQKTGPVVAELLIKAANRAKTRT
jgi:glycosyltransferase involved in cell wall biosynthesis